MTRMELPTKSLSIDNIHYLTELTDVLLQENYNTTYITACLEYANKLLLNNLPVIFDYQHLSLLLGLTTEELWPFVELSDELCYTETSIPKKNGDKRRLSIPSKNLKYIQKWIQINILDNIPISKSATGFYKGRSILKNANKHLQKECLLNIDIKDFFPSIDFNKIFMVFRYYGYTKEISYILANLCTYMGFLPQGSPASPALSNIICLKLDKRLMKLSETYKADYTRYADDMTFSGSKSIINMLPTIDLILIDEGFIINDQKTRIAYKHQRQEVTGLIVNSGTAKIPREFKRSFKTEIYYCKKYGMSSHQNKIEDNHAFFKEHMYGKAYYIKMIEPELGMRLLQDLDTINWEY